MEGEVNEAGQGNQFPNGNEGINSHPLSSDILPQLNKSKQNEPLKASEKPTGQKVFNLTEALKRDFGLTDEQINQLREKGLDLEKFNPEDLVNEEKRKQFFEKVKELDNLTDEQKDKISQVEQLVSQEKPTKEEAQAMISKKRQEIEASELTDEEKKQALAELDEIQKTLDQPPPETQQQKESFKQRLVEKAPTYIKYAGLGLGLLILILAFRGLTETSGQRG